MNTEIYQHIPTYENGNWSYTDFDSRVDFYEFLKNIFKEPGQYNFDETSKLFNEQGRLFNQNSIYCLAPSGTKDYIKYWDTEKEKCRKGVKIGRAHV